MKTLLVVIGFATVETITRSVRLLFIQFDPKLTKTSTVPLIVQLKIYLFF